MTELLRLGLVGVVGGLGLFAVILLPAILLQRRRFGRVRVKRLVGSLRSACTRWRSRA